MGEQNCLKGIAMLTQLFEEHEWIEATSVVLLGAYLKQNRLSEWDELCAALINTVRNKYKADSVELAFMNLGYAIWIKAE